MNATALLVLHLQAKHLPAPEFEYRFHPKRRFRFDLAWPQYRVAVEIDGATWSRGRHVRGSGHEADCVKRNLAGEQGWLVLTYPNRLVENGEAIRQLERILGPRVENPCAPGRRRGKTTDVAGAAAEV